MTVHLETEVVGGSYDAVTKAHSYVVTRDGKRWTVTIPEVEFDRFGPMTGTTAIISRTARRRHLATVLEAAMKGAPDA